MPTLFLISTPIGNMEDITHRAVRVLGEVPVLACEDTRHTRFIFERYGIAWPQTVLSYHEHNQEQAGRRILDLLAGGQNVALCTDAGTPGLSDPGFRVVRDALAAGHAVDLIPGPSAITHAIVVSGLSTASFTFKGFPPKKPGPRRRFLEADRNSVHTLVLYESPFRVATLLREALEVFGDRHAAVCIELTKKFERVSRGLVSELLSQFEGKDVKGEVTVVVAGRTRKDEIVDAPEPETETE
jgi:16S rRNA (cytidine1402-2'-O)-methyltransferase